MQNGAPLFAITKQQTCTGLTPEGCFERHCQKEGRSAYQTAQEFLGFT